VTHNDAPLAIINIYRHPNRFTPFSSLNRLLHTLRCSYKDIIITGDLNAHHFWWGCDYEDSAGKTFSRLIDTHNLVIANDRLPTILLPPNSRKSVIDLVLTTPSLGTLCNSITTHDTLGSDHFPIITNISSSFTKNRNFVYKLQTTKKDLILLSLKLKETFSVLVSSISNNLSASYQTFEQHIKHHLYSLFPPNARLPRSEFQRKFPPSPPWWNENCQVAVDNRRIATGNYRRHPSL